MKRTILVFGGIAGATVSILMLPSAWACHTSGSYSGSMVIGYALMLVAFIFVFVGVKNYRDKQLGGFITFGRALVVGLSISLIASTIYVIAWLILYYGFMPDFMDRMITYSIAELKTQNLSAAKLKAEMDGIKSMAELYKSPVFVVLFTYAEILPVGLVTSLASALILMRRKKASMVA